MSSQRLIILAKLLPGNRIDGWYVQEASRHGEMHTRNLSHTGALMCGEPLFKNPIALDEALTWHVLLHRHQDMENSGCPEPETARYTIPVRSVPYGKRRVTAVVVQYAWEAEDNETWTISRLLNTGGVEYLQSVNPENGAAVWTGRVSVYNRGMALSMLHKLMTMDMTFAHKIV